jgi:hypothetical protein
MSANLTNAGSDFDPVLFMMESRARTLAPISA